MMKCEFEKMIEKEVSPETFEMYETMYNALPESVSKQQFVAMLNVAAIPESESAIARRAERERLIDRITAEIDTQKAEIAEMKKEIENMAAWIAEDDDAGYWKREIKWTKSRIKERQQKIAELKSVII